MGAVTKPVTKWTVTVETECPACGGKVDLLSQPEMRDWYDLIISNHFGECGSVKAKCLRCGKSFKAEMDFDG